MHSHVLPGVDDGANSVATSLEMLRESWRQGVETVIATSHCYVKKESDINKFIKKRNESYNILMDAIQKQKDEFPDIRLGCEVHLERDISKYEALEKLCISGTNYILIEMPYMHWNTYLYDALYYMTLRGLRPIMAHIERFYNHVNDFSNLTDLDLIYQINAESFLNPNIKKTIPYFFKNRMVHLIGSDMHNMDTRRPRILEAYQKIEYLYGCECVDYLIKNSRMILDNRYLDFFQFKKKNILKRLCRKN